MGTTDQPHARLATERDVPGIVRVCSEGWRDTYAAIYPVEHVERIIAEFYTPERVTSDIGPRGDDWGGYVVAELDGDLLVAGGGGLIESKVGELFVLYADPYRRRQGGGAAVLGYVAGQQRGLGATEQWVSVEPESELGRSFYRSQGFIERERRPAYRGDGESLRLCRPL